MADDAAVEHYLAADYLDPGELLLYATVADECRDQAILDLGVGGGRTVPILRSISANYVAIDYTPAMVQAVRRRFPAVDVRHGDARDLSAFEQHRFALVVFSCAGVDMMGPADRARVLSEVRRVLRPGGAFVFSTHNWEHRRAQREPPSLAPVTWSAHPLRLARSFARTARSAVQLMRHRRVLARLGERHEHWAVLNSHYHGWSTLMHYVTLAEQRRQLETAGFGARALAATHEGAWIAGESTSTFMLHVLARPRAG